MIKKIKKMLPIFIVVGIIYTLIKLNYLNQYSYSFLSNQDEYIYATEKVYDFMIKIDVMNYHKVYR